MAASTGSQRFRVPSEQLKLALLVAAGALPPLIVRAGEAAGSHYVLYREPKAVMAHVLGWTLVLVLLGDALREPGWTRLRRHCSRPVVLAFLSWSSLAAASLAWSWVGELAAYELRHNLLFIAILLVLPPWLTDHPTRCRSLLAALLVPGAVMSAVGIAQALSLVPWLIPIDPQFGVSHPSLMGYKNPMALFLCCQLFLLAGCASSPNLSRGKRGSLWLLFFLELGYLATLLSRTSYLALIAGALVLAGLLLERRLRAATRSRRMLLLFAIVLLVVVLAAALLLAADMGETARDEPITGVGERFTSMAALLTPKAYLDSDRGTYFRNTLHMVRHNPWGVGLGNWQAAYPVYRRYDRYRSFTETHQVRRAHSDHVQALGELGLFGVLAWLVAWALLLLVPLRAARSTASLTLAGVDASFFTAQIVTVLIAMSTDYLFEMPAHRFFLAFVCGLCIAVVALPRTRGPGAEAMLSRERVAGVGAAGTRKAMLAAVSLLAAAGLLATLVLLFQASHWRQMQRSVQIQSAARAPLDVQALSGTLTTGVDFANGLARTKADHRTFQTLSQLALAADDSVLAQAFVNEALNLAPWDPQNWQLAARVHRTNGEVERARQASEVAEEIRHRVTEGPPDVLVFPTE